MEERDGELTGERSPGKNPGKIQCQVRYWYDLDEMNTICSQVFEIISHQLLVELLACMSNEKDLQL